MRPELNILEQIDNYLSGAMSGNEQAIFENQMANNVGLKSLVNDQKLMIKTLNRQAILADINAVIGSSGSTTWYNQLSTWIVLGILASGLLTAIIYFNQDTKNIIVENSIVQEVIKNDSEQEELLIKVEENSSLKKEKIVIPNKNSSIKLAIVQQIETQTDTLITTNLLEDNEIVEREEVDSVIVDEPERNRLNKNKEAIFSGGRIAMNRYFEKNIKFPGTAKRKKIEGIVEVNFFVYTDGRVEWTKIECIEMTSTRNNRPFGPMKTLRNRKTKKLFKNEATRLFRNMPKWEPATDSFGTPQLAPYTIYIDFDSDGSKVYGLQFDNSDGDYKRLDKDVLNP